MVELIFHHPFFMFVFRSATFNVFVHMGAWLEKKSAKNRETVLQNPKDDV